MSDALQWGRCLHCYKPGLALAVQFEEPVRATCGFCGAKLEPTKADLAAEAAKVIAERLERNVWVLRM